MDDIEVIKTSLKHYELSDDQIRLLKVLYEAGDNWVSLTEIEDLLNKNEKGAVGGILGAFGNKVGYCKKIPEADKLKYSKQSGYFFETKNKNPDEEFSYKLRTKCREVIDSPEFAKLKEAISLEYKDIEAIELNEQA